MKVIPEACRVHVNLRF